MKYLITSLLIYHVSIGITIAQKKDDINYSDAYQIDSSEYFIIPRVLDHDDKDDYGKGKGTMMWGNYRDIIFYNTRTNQSKKVFNTQLAMIEPFFTNRNYYYNYDTNKKPEKPENILSNHIVYIARTDDFNGDKGLDSNDPAYIFISNRQGEHLRQITPNGVHVISWTISADQKILLVKAMTDKNNNKKFGNGDDHLYYRIDLSDDISKIQCYPINL